MYFLKLFSGLRGKYVRSDNCRRGGPAGLTAGIYAVRFGLNTIILEKSEISGQIALADVVENYPGFPEISGGLELMEKYKSHAQGNRGG